MGCSPALEVPHVAIALDAPFAAAPRTRIHTGAFAVPALAALGAGAIHASAIGAHAEHRQAVVTFALVAAAQIGLGAIALVSNRRLVGIALAATNVAFFAGWIVAKQSGISFIEGLDEVEKVQWADALAATMAAVAVLGVVVAAVRKWQFPATDALTRVLALPVAAITVTGMVAAGSHQHAGAHEEAAAATHGHDDATAEVTSAVPVKPFVPGEPIDLGGVEGVTAAQQAEAELVLGNALYYLPHWADYHVAEAEGWSSIGDGVTGFEHFVNQSTFDDGKILDATAPESLVYENDRATGAKTLVAAMYMLPPGSTMADVPTTGGKLMQWHIHDNLCFTAEAKVAALRAPGGPCPAGLFVGGENPMIHVWITSHPCGPFAALEGIAGGTIAEGETRLCDHAHGA
jgi:hypothetical protein